MQKHEQLCLSTTVFLVLDVLVDIVSWQYIGSQAVTLSFTDVTPHRHQAHSLADARLCRCVFDYASTRRMTGHNSLCDISSFHDTSLTAGYKAPVPLTCNGLTMHNCRD